MLHRNLKKLRQGYSVTAHMINELIAPRTHLELFLTYLPDPKVFLTISSVSCTIPLKSQLFLNL